MIKKYIYWFHLSLYNKCLFQSNYFKEECYEKSGSNYFVCSIILISSCHKTLFLSNEKPKFPLWTSQRHTAWEWALQFTKSLLTSNHQFILHWYHFLLSFSGYWIDWNKENEMKICLQIAEVVIIILHCSLHTTVVPENWSAARFLSCSKIWVRICPAITGQLVQPQ